MDSAAAAGADQFAGFLKVRHTTLLHPNLHNAFVFFLSVESVLPFREIVGQRLFDIHILAGGAGVHRHGNMPVIGRADQDRVDVLALENFHVIFGGEGAWIGQLASLFEVLVVNVTNGGDANIGDFLERLHESTAAASRAKTADIQRLIGGTNVESWAAQARRLCCLRRPSVSGRNDD